MPYTTALLRLSGKRNDYPGIVETLLSCAMTGPQGDLKMPPANCLDYARSKYSRWHLDSGKYCIVSYQHLRYRTRLKKSFATRCVPYEPSHDLESEVLSYSHPRHRKMPLQIENSIGIHTEEGLYVFAAFR